jgi:DNA-damage-inducible protein D
LDHFPDVKKTIAMPKGASKEIEDFMLTRYACYLVAQNGDPRKEEIAFAQSYFAIQTRKQELVEERIKLKERFDAREKLAKSETELSKLIYERGVDDKGFARIRSKGDEAMIEGKKILKETVTYSNSKEEAIKDTNILLVFTDWDEFKQPDFRELKNAGIKAIFDGRNLYDPKEVREQGIDYFGIGRN